MFNETCESFFFPKPIFIQQTLVRNTFQYHLHFTHLHWYIIYVILGGYLALSLSLYLCIRFKKKKKVLSMEWLLHWEVTSIDIDLNEFVSDAGSLRWAWIYFEQKKSKPPAKLLTLNIPSRSIFSEPILAICSDIRRHFTSRSDLCVCWANNLNHHFHSLIS